MYTRNLKKWRIVLENKHPFSDDDWKTDVMDVYTEVFEPDETERHYGNGKTGCVLNKTMTNRIATYDLRYLREIKDHHRFMLENYWGENLVEAKELPKTEAVG